MSARASMRQGAVAALLIVVALGVRGCSGGDPDADRQSAVTPASSSASGSPSPPVPDGHFTFTLLSFQCGITGVTGSHSDAPPEGQFCAARLRVANADPEFHTFDARRQRLEGVAGRAARPATFPMAVRRQHDTVELGGHTLVEVELWYDIPVDARPSGLRVTGDRDPAGFLDRTPIAHPPDGVVIVRTPTMQGR